MTITERMADLLALVEGVSRAENARRKSAGLKKQVSNKEFLMYQQLRRDLSTKKELAPEPGALRALRMARSLKQHDRSLTINARRPGETQTKHVSRADNMRVRRKSVRPFGQKD